MPFPKPCATSASGSVIDCLMNASSLPFRTWSRSGPVPPWVPASASVWQPPHAVAPVSCLPFVKSALASGAAPCWPPPPPPPPAPPAGALVPAHPGPELVGAHDVRGLAHERVPEPAQLGADDRVAADRVVLRRHAVARRDAGDGVDLHAEVRHPEVVDDVLGVDVELHRLAGRQVELGAGEAAAALVVVEGPRELLAGDLDDALVARGRRLLDVAHDDVGVGDERDDEDRRGAPSR